MFLASFLTFYLCLLIIVSWQDWQLRKRLSSAAWKLDVAGFVIAFIVLVIRVGLFYYGSPSPVLSFFINAIGSSSALICFIISRHLLHRDIEEVLNQSLRRRETRTNEP